jgi:iron complex outermembrane recepter protein
MKLYKIRSISASSTAALALILAAGVAAPACAQAAEEASDENARDIVVTARKRSEDIQTVPLTITAYTAEDLQERNISNMADLGNSTPGLAITSITGGNVLGIYLRGLAPANTANDPMSVSLSTACIRPAATRSM